MTAGAPGLQVADPVPPAGRTRNERVSRTIVAALLAAVVLRLILQALLSPAFEGPDEPFHLARVLTLARSVSVSAWRGEAMPVDLVRAVSSFPCGPDLGRVFACPPFDGSRKPAIFNTLREPPPAAGALTVAGQRARNYESQQPPLAYLLMAPGIALFESLAPGQSLLRTARELLLLRGAAVAAVVVALLFPLRRLTADWSDVERGLGLGVLLAPGAAEALGRAALEGPLFLWSAVFLLALRRPGSSALLISMLGAAGLLIKASALPVLAYGIVRLASERRRAAAVALLGAVPVFLLVQMSRGWSGGGTLELHLRGVTAAPITAAELVAGLARSAWVFAKSAFWLGGWSFLRPPLWLLLLAGGVALAGLAALRLAGRLSLGGSAEVSILVALSGFVVFALLVRRLYGVWAPGGWYLWGWAPWLAVIARERLRWLDGWAPRILAAVVVTAVAGQVAWLLAAVDYYGG